MLCIDLVLVGGWWLLCCWLLSLAFGNVFDGCCLCFRLLCIDDRSLFVVYCLLSVVCGVSWVGLCVACLVFVEFCLVFVEFCLLFEVVVCL